MHVLKQKFFAESCKFIIRIDGERDSTGGKSKNKQTLDRPTKCKQITVFS